LAVAKIGRNTTIYIYGHDDYNAWRQAQFCEIARLYQLSSVNFAMQRGPAFLTVQSRPLITRQRSFQDVNP